MNKIIQTKLNNPGPNSVPEKITWRKKNYSTCFATEKMVRVEGNSSWFRLYEAYDKKTMVCIRKFIKIKGVRVDIA